MPLTAISGVIDRRILVNYRVDPQVLRRLVPAPFRPKLVNGHAIAGICLIRLNHVRPSFLPIRWGICSENAAHRIAVEWDEQGQVVEGVFIPRRDTSSRLNAWAGGRLFPGVHHHARFRMDETAEELSVSVQSDDGAMSMAVAARVAQSLNPGSVFETLQTASGFFERGAVGYSVTSEEGRFDGIELRCRDWQVTPLAVDRVVSSFFDDPTQFPPGSAAFDCALLMRGIEHQWIGRDTLCCGEKAATAA